MATVLAGIQYLPQIWMTWNLGDVGSLSIPMMLIQTPGSFVWSGSLAARLGLAGWSTWGVFLVTGCLQGCLLVMGICFEVKARRERRQDESETVSSIRANLIGIVLTSNSKQIPDATADLFKAGASRSRLTTKEILRWRTRARRDSHLFSESHLENRTEVGNKIWKVRCSFTVLN